MLAIGRALTARPKLVLLDEPSMGLAPKLVDQIFNVIADFRRRGLTVLPVEQNANAALTFADRGYVPKTGRITITGRGDELHNDPRVRAAYHGILGTVADVVSFFERIVRQGIETGEFRNVNRRMAALDRAAEWGGAAGRRCGN